MHFYYANILK